MVISNCALTGVLEYSSWPALWLMMVGPLAATAAAIALSGLHLRPVARAGWPRLGHAELAAMGVSRVR
jgi:hypothetical protein